MKIFFFFLLHPQSFYSILSIYEAFCYSSLFTTGDFFMITKNFWELLEEKQNSLTKSGLIIADYLTKHAEDAQFLSISSLAKECSMAEATIYRFCKQLGFEGYNEMKIPIHWILPRVLPRSVSMYTLPSRQRSQIR